MGFNTFSTTKVLKFFESPVNTGVLGSLLKRL